MVTNSETQEFLANCKAFLKKEYVSIPFNIQLKLPIYSGFYEIAYSHPSYHIYEFNLDDGKNGCNCRVDKIGKTYKLTCTCDEENDCLHKYLCINDLFEKSKYIQNNISKKITLGNHANEWRFIPLEKFIKKNLHKLYSHNGYLRIHNWDILLVNDETIQLLGFGYYQDENFTIEFNKKNDAIGFRCLSCSQFTSKFCTHQSLVFSEEEIIRDLKWFLESVIDVVSFYGRMEKQLGISKSTIDKYFLPVVYNKRLHLKPIADNYFINFNEFNNYFEIYDEDKPVDKSKFFKQLTLNRKLEYACCWKVVEDYNLVIQGVPKKNERNLSTHIKETENINVLDSKDVSFLKPLFDDESYISNKEAIKILNINIDSLNNIQHYYDIEGDLYAKIKKKNLVSFVFSEHKVNYSFVKIESDPGIVKFKLEFEINGSIIDIEDFYIYPNFILRNDIAYIYSSIECYKFCNSLDKISPEFSFLESSLVNSDTALPKKIQAIISSKQSDNNYRFAKQIYITKESDFILFEPSIIYNDISIDLLSVDVQDEHLLDLIYDELCYFQGLHHDFATSSVSEYFYLHKDDVLNNNWFFAFILSLQENDYKIFGQDIISKLKINPNRFNIQMNIQSKTNWFEPQVVINFGKITVSQESWLKAIKRNDQYIELSDGTVGLISTEWYDKLREIYDNSVLEKKSLRISKLRFNSIDKLFPLILEDALREELEERKNAFKEFSSNQIYPLPKALNCTLRNYQYEGYQWLMFLDNFGFGGVLADDMGLGKTIQMIVFLQMQKEYGKGTSLVVVPKSILGNWMDEMDKFSPELKYLDYTGLARHEEYLSILTHDVVLSTFDTVTRDVDKLLKLCFNYIVLDESQNIKNPSSKRYKALKLLRSSNKLAMTGTPIENNTFDLYAQFSFVNPGFFGSIAQFKSKFSDKIDVHRDKHSAEALRNIIYPFLLRRTKEQVASDLPDKNEIVLYCELPEAQRQMYETIRLGVLKDLSKTKSNLKFKALEGMLKLRKLCNSPLLIDKSLKGENAFSIKLNTLINKIQEHPGHKALVFSQFVQTLSIIKSTLDEKGIKYAYLDGASKKRRKIVEDFENDDSCSLFLISLKAGNTGLNLTSADYVYIFDPWWNPAVEAQAIDRTHRIGQTKTVFAYKLICKNTIEEKILELQKAKKGLAEDLIRVDDNSFKNLEKKDLLNLFS